MPLFYLCIRISLLVAVMTDSNNSSDMHAPTYNELFGLVRELQEKLRMLETASPAPTNGSSSNIQQNRQPVEYRLLPDLDRSIKPFDGLVNSLIAEDWLGSVDGLAVTNDWPFRYRLQFVRANLIGAARNWYLSEEFVDWADFLVKFRAAFVRQLSQTDRWNAMCSRVQEYDESTVVYFYDKLRLCKALALMFPETRDHMIQGLRKQPLSVYVMGRNHSNPTELLNDIQDWERMMTLRAEKFTSNPKAPKPQRSIAQRQQGDSEVEQRNRIVSVLPCKSVPATNSKPANWGSNKDTVRHVTSTVSCYNYGERGHISRDCNKPKKQFQCTLCGKLGHTRSRCPDGEARNPAPNSDSAMLVSAVATPSMVNPYMYLVSIYEQS